MMTLGDGDVRSVRRGVLDLGIAISRASSIPEILSTVIRAVDDLIPHDRAIVALANEERTELEILGIDTSATDEVLGVGSRVPFDESNVLGWVAVNGRPHLRRSLDEPFPFGRVQRSREVPSHIICPLRGRQEVLGVLTIGTYTEGAFDEHDVKVFTRFAHLAGLAIENQRNFETVSDLAVRDGLTGAFNHRHLQEILGREIHRSDRYGTQVSLLMIDLDHFKRFNDRYGHPAGDQILRQTVAVIQEHLRASDMVFRYGGEEFSVLLPETGADDALTVAEKLRTAIREQNAYRHTADDVGEVTVSIGQAAVPTDASTREGLIACADQALYRAKDLGRDRSVRFSDIGDIRAIRDALAVEADSDLLAPQLRSPRWTKIRAHAERVEELAHVLATTLDLPPGDVVSLRVAAAFHDVGELGLPPEMLDKSGPLDSRERIVLSTHPHVGASILRTVRVSDVLRAVVHHHERYDGTGYPAGLQGEEIPLLARVLAIADTFDALVTPRPYRERAMTPDEAYEELRGAAGLQLDPRLVSLFIQAHRGQHSDSR